MLPKWVTKLPFLNLINTSLKDICHHVIWWSTYLVLVQLRLYDLILGKQGKETLQFVWVYMGSSYEQQYSWKFHLMTGIELPSTQVSPSSYLSLYGHIIRNERSYRLHENLNNIPRLWDNSLSKRFCNWPCNSIFEL